MPLVSEGALIHSEAAWITEDDCGPLAIVKASSGLFLKSLEQSKEHESGFFLIEYISIT